MDLLDVMPGVLLQGWAMWVVGLTGCVICDRLKVNRLIGGVLGGVLLSATVLGHVAPSLHRKLVEGGAQEYQWVQEYNAKIGQEREALSSTGATRAAMDEFNARAVKEGTEFGRALEQAGRQRRIAVALAWGFPAILCAVVVVLGSLAKSRGCRDELQTSLVASLVTVVSMGGVAFWFTHTEIGDPWRVVAVLTLVCAIPALPLNPRMTAQPVWCWLYEPILYALCGAYFDAKYLLPVSQKDVFAIAVILAIFSVPKIIGAAMWSHRRQPWGESFLRGVGAAAGNPLALGAAYVLFAFMDPRGDAAELFVILVLINWVMGVVASGVERSIDALDEPRP